MNSLKDSLVAGYRDLINVEMIDPFTSLVVLPTTFAGGSLLALQVTFAGDAVTVTDRGQSADELLDAGVDLQARTAAKSFAGVRESTGLPGSIGAEGWELSVTVDRADVAVAVQAIADAAMRSDGLRVLSRTQTVRSFADRVVSTVGERYPVVPKAPLVGRNGGQRKVTARVDAGSGQYFLQALPGYSSTSRWEAYDHASGLFLDASPDLKHRVAVMQEGDWEHRQVEGLKQICRVVQEADVPEFVRSLAA